MAALDEDGHRNWRRPGQGFTLPWPNRSFDPGASTFGAPMSRVDEHTVSGPTFGAGVAMALGPRTSAFVEISHTDFGKQMWGYDAHLTENALRVGVNVRIGQ